jgi:metal-sulfur cluster biosynthetic enzyme
MAKLFKIAAAKAVSPGVPRTREQLEKEVWSELKTCFDPEIPVNVVDLGLVYDCRLDPLGAPDRYKADMKITLTAPGCGMGPVLAQDVQNKLLSIDGIDEANVASRATKIYKVVVEWKQQETRKVNDDLSQTQFEESL